MVRDGNETKKPNRAYPYLHELIIEAIKERKVFIGYMMLCRYLNGRGYIRYGCNAGYPKNKTLGRDRIHPCKVICPGSKIYPSKIRYWCIKLSKENLIFTKKVLYEDSKNPFSWVTPHKLDTFVIITKTKSSYKEFMNTIIP